MDKNSILEFNNIESVSDVLNELLRSGAQKLIHNAVEAELREFMSQHQGVTEEGTGSRFPSITGIKASGSVPKRSPHPRNNQECAISTGWRWILII